MVDIEALPPRDSVDWLPTLIGTYRAMSNTERSIFQTEVMHALMELRDLRALKARWEAAPVTQVYARDVGQYFSLTEGCVTAALPAIYIGQRVRIVREDG